MADIDDLFTHPNAGANEVDESRVGPPLTYVGEKLGHSLGHVHRLANTARTREAESSGEGDAGPDEMQRDAGLEAVAAFRYGLTAYLALYNMLGMISDHRKLDALLDLDEEAFEDWLATIEREGSVSG
jgi:hypothetical protein